jgi:sulfur-oxidizing protein SoxZ
MIEPNNVPIKIRAVNDPKTGFTEVRILMTHPMDTGRLNNTTGQIIPIWHIIKILIKLENIVVVSAQFGSAVSRNPYLYFKIKGGVKNELLTVSWTDNQNKTRQDTAKII